MLFFSQQGSEVIETLSGSRTGILSYILNFTWDFIMNHQFQWDDITFTIYDIFKFTCLVFVICYFIWHICFYFAGYVAKLKYVD